MKTFLILSCLVAFAYGEVFNCHCGAFATVWDSEEEVLPFPPSHIEDCSNNNVCASRCTNEWELLTNDGDLCTVTSDGTRVGQMMCEFLANKDVHFSTAHTVYLYHRTCDGPWMFDGQISKQDLKCKNGHLALNCH